MVMGYVEQAKQYALACYKNSEKKNIVYVCPTCIRLLNRNIYATYILGKI